MDTLFDFVTYTKGIEYLIAVAFLVMFIPFWFLATSTRAPQPERAAAAETVGRLEDMVGGFLVPDSVYFHPGHAWARVDDHEPDLVTVGIDDFGQKLVGNIEGIQLPDIGAEVVQGARAWNLRLDGESIGMLSPVDGEVVAVNPDLTLEPEKINRDPFGSGWLLKVRPTRKSANIKGLLSGNFAKRWIDEATSRLMENSEYATGPVLTDAGPSRQGMARTIDAENWDRIVRDFFLVTE